MLIRPDGHLPIVDEAVDRLKQFTKRDREFSARFGVWQRPEFMPRYDLEQMGRLIQYHPADLGTIDVEGFLNMLRSREDRKIAAEISKWVLEEFLDIPASDTTLKKFRLHFLRRLDSCGF